jgi:hypothetical protein
MFDVLDLLGHLAPSECFSISPKHCSENATTQLPFYSFPTSSLTFRLLPNRTVGLALVGATS